ncbi:hypothetical protein K474DRAFT_841604 [Panus rudis PR-1116 ss-1]|nr:hypothetical protein K474DRAFT_841604 [Panus rudis PR-1116 ss-1]
MRTCSIAVSLVAAAAALNTGLVGAAPLDPVQNIRSAPSPLNEGSSRDNNHLAARHVSISPREFWQRTVDTFTTNLTKRVSDDSTMGGNAHTGNSGNVSGGSVNNPDSTMNEGMPTIMNVNSYNAGTGGKSASGCAASGKSASGAGGNASSGNSGNAEGGSVGGSPSGMINMNSSNAGEAGETMTGCANGGDSA